MKYKIFIGNRPIILEHENLDKCLNVDALTTIDTSNLFGEAVTVSAAANRIGLLKAEVESQMSLAKLEYKMYEGKFKSKLRKQAAENSGHYFITVDGEKVKVKATESALNTSFETDSDWIELKKKFIQAERNFNALTVLYENIRDKGRKLNGLVSGTTPEDFVNEMVEGVVNGILIKKKK